MLLNEPVFNMLPFQTVGEATICQREKEHLSLVLDTWAKYSNIHVLGDIEAPRYPVTHSRLLSG